MQNTAPRDVLRGGEGAVTDRAFCYFRCLAQACYREARHIGPSDDGAARCRIPATATHLSLAAVKCKDNRALLEDVELWRRAKSESSTDGALRPYVETTGLIPTELPALFRCSRWRNGFGGELWAQIAEALLELKTEIDADAADRAEAVCDRIAQLEHNSGRLVPTAKEWSASKWVQQKWPEVCP